MATLAAVGQQAGVFQVESSASASLRARGGDVVVMPGRGLRLPPGLSFDRWLSVGRRLAEIQSSSAWCLGDWLVFGEASYEGRYREAIVRTSLDYQTLRNYAWVANRFVLSRRRDSLSFGHHAEVAALPEAEQDFWLRKAQESGWSVKGLRREVRISHSERSARGDGQSCGDLGTNQDARLRREAKRLTARLNVTVTPARLQAYQAAAARAGSALEEWAVLVLDDAAAQAPRMTVRAIQSDSHGSNDP